MNTALLDASMATGIFSVVLLTAVIVIGVLVIGKEGFAGPAGTSLSRLHRDGSLLAMAFLAAHVVTSITFTPLDGRKVASVFIPETAAYDPLWTGLGAIAFDLFLAVTIVSFLRQRIGHRAWLAIHWLSYAAWPLTVIHGLGIGDDLHSAWGLAITWTCVTCVGLALAWRVLMAVRGAAPDDSVARILAESGRAPERPAARNGRVGLLHRGTKVPPSGTHRRTP